MKWHNKGHEYDAVYQRMEEITSYYLFGAGDYGNQFFQVILTTARRNRGRIITV